MKRNTLIILIVFVLFAAVYLVLQEKPELLVRATATPEVTAIPKLFAGLETTAIQEVHLRHPDGSDFKLVRSGEPGWINGDGVPVDTGKAEQLLSELLATSQLVELPADSNPADLGLTQPVLTITLTEISGKVHSLKIGSGSPTLSGYYVKLDGNPPGMVSKYAIEAVLELEKGITATETPQFTPETTPSAAN